MLKLIRYKIIRYKIIIIQNAKIKKLQIQNK